MNDWWTDERVESVVTARFVASHLNAYDQRRLNETVFEELSNDTYLDWILSKARRLFLILFDSDCVHHIFYLIDQSWEDSSLPIAERDVPTLHLPTTPGRDVVRTFFRNQFKYLIRTIRQGEHIRYSSSASVPIHVIDHKLPDGYHAAQDRVRLPQPNNRTFLRIREPMNDDQTEVSILSEITAIRAARHEHIASVFGSYSQGSSMYLLTYPAAQWSLKGFLADQPKLFKSVPKPERHLHLLSWPHCLANAVAWIHANGFVHGAISPSRIVIDDGFNVVLGHFKDVRAAGPPLASKDIEYYQYAAPELHQRRLVVQRFAAHQGPTLDPLNEYAELRGSVSTIARSFAHSTRSASRQDCSHSISCHGSPIDLVSPISSSSAGSRPDHMSISGASTRSSSSGGSYGAGSSSRERTRPGDLRHQIVPEARTAVVQTFKSVSSDLQAADVFSLAAVTMDILTVMCGESVSSFSKHRATASRTASRGASAVDSSFHANLHQVSTWAATLAKAAEKKGKKKGNMPFEAIGPNLSATLLCLNRSASRRLRADMLSLTFEANLRDFAGVREGHCTLKMKDHSGGSHRDSISTRGRVVHV